MKTRIRYGILPACAIFLSCLLLVIYLYPSSAVKEEYHCQVMEVPNGYGYVVTLLPAGDTLIVQPYIPALGGYTPFGTKEKALATGRLVCRKLSEGDNPAVSREEVLEVLKRDK